MSDKIELLPCPFCGQQDAFAEQLDSDASVVICQGRIDEHSACLARGPVGVQESDDEDQPGKDAAIREWNHRAALAKQPAPAVPEGWALVPIKPSIEMVEAGYEASLGQPDRSGHARTIEVYDSILAAAPAAPVALGIDGCGKPLCGGIEFAGGHHPLCQHHAAPATPEPAPPAQYPGLYAIHYRDNWDGEGDTYYLVAQRAEDGRWLNYESGRELLEYEGDAVLEVWPLTSGTTSDKYRAELYDEVWEQARSMGYGNVTMALAELVRMKAAGQPAQAVPVAQEPVGYCSALSMKMLRDGSVFSVPVSSAAFRDPGADECALYAAPPAAEQPDAVKVPRELVARLDRMYSEGMSINPELEELRALLGKEGE